MALSTEDIIEINALYARYNHTIDHARHEDFAANFTPDGSLEAMGTTTTGRADLAAFSEGTQAMVPGIRHVVSNVLVDGDGESAEGSAYLLVHVPGDDGRKVMVTGVYADRLQRVDGSWLFSERVLHADG